MDIDLIHNTLPKSDIELFGLTTPFIFFTGDTKQKLFKKCGIFHSSGQSKKAGQIGEFPEGFSQHKIGKHRVTVLNCWKDSNND